MVVASTRAAAETLEAHPDLEFLLFNEEFLSEGDACHEVLKL